MSKNEISGNVNYTLQQLMNMQGQTFNMVNVINQTVGNLAKRLDDYDAKFEAQDKALTALGKDFTAFKDKSEISYEQRRTIRNAVKFRVYTVLDVPQKKEDMDMSDKVTLQKYGSLFFNRCYSETAKLGHLGRPYGLTTKENYDYALADIEAWSPSNGVNGLKAEADEDATAKKIAQEQGYKR